MVRVCCRFTSDLVLRFTRSLVFVLQVFQKVSEEKKGKVHVFYCGAPALAKVIKAQCEHFGFNFYKENF